jgi:hypothetical protein
MWNRTMNPFYDETETRYKQRVYPVLLAASSALGLVRSTVMGWDWVDCTGP